MGTWAAPLIAHACPPSAPEQECTNKVLTGGVDVGIYADRQPDQDVAAISPLLDLGIRPRPEVELGLRFGAASMFANHRTDGQIREVRASNFVFGMNWVRDRLSERHHTSVGFMFALPTNFATDERERETLDYAVAVRGGMDPWQWSPATMGLVVPVAWTWRGRYLQAGIDGAIAGLFAASSNPDRPGAAAQVRGHAAFASKWVVVGGFAGAASNGRRDGDKTQAAVGPFADVPLCFGAKRRPSCPLTLTSRATVNLDAPFGFAGDGLRVWGMQFGLRWALRETT